MHNQLVPTLVLVVLPVIFLSWRTGLHRHRALRWLLSGALVLAVLLALPLGGLDPPSVAKLNLLICGGLSLILLMRHLGVDTLRRRATYLSVLGATAVIALLSYYNFFDYHGARTFVHLHDVAHYYLGSKYYEELGYTDLYTAMVRAEAELYDNHFITLQARDLETYEQVHIGHLLARSEPVKAAFSAARWEGFKEDVAVFRETMGAHYARVLLDHGFNPTPVWALLGNTLAQKVPAGSRAGIYALALLDQGLLLAMLAVVAWAFGLPAMLLLLIHFCLIFGTGFGWTGGAFLRYLWLFGLVAGTCCLRRRRHGLAGALLALATSLRVFPVVFAVPVAFRGIGLFLRLRRLPVSQRRFWICFLTTIVLALSLTATLPRGLAHWQEFRDQMDLHVGHISRNLVGLTEVLTYGPGPVETTQQELTRSTAVRGRLVPLQLLLVLLPGTLLVFRLCRWHGEATAIFLALPLLFLGFSLASYYYAFLILLVLRYRNDDRALALIFAVEAGSYVLALFEDRNGTLFFYRSVQILFLYLALHLHVIRRELRFWSLRKRRLAPGTS